MFDFDITALYFPTFVRTELFGRDIPGWYARWHLALSQDVGWCVPDVSCTPQFTSLAGKVIKWLNHQLPMDKMSLRPTKPELKQDTPRPVETKSPILFTGRPWERILGWQVFSFSISLELILRNRPNATSSKLASCWPRLHDLVIKRSAMA